MAKKAKLVLGIIFLILAIIFAIILARGVYTYVDGKDVLESQRNEREEMEEKGEDTSGIDHVISENEDLMEGKTQAIQICAPLFIIFLVLGIVFLVLYRKDAKEDALAPPPIMPPPGPSAGQLYAADQGEIFPPQQPPQQPGYPPQQPPPQYPPQQPPQQPGYPPQQGY